MKLEIKIDKNKEVVGRLPFEPFAEFDNLCVGELIDVTKTETESKEEARWDYAGKTIPLLAFTFKQWKKKESDKDRFMTMSFTPISLTDKDGVEREMSKIIVSFNQMWDKIKHLHDQYMGNKNYKPMDAEPEFNGSTVDERLAEFDTFFEAVVNDFKLGKDKKTPIYNDGQFLSIVMVASGLKKSYLAVPSFVGKGIFELFKSKDGKIVTDLRIPITETTKLGATAMAQANPQASNTDLPPEILELMNKG